MAYLGIRVMRGPDWDAGDLDGGEGHLGTVKALLSNHRLHVLWDTGQESTCRAGSDGKRDLRVYDTAQAGVRHPNTKCAECEETNIFGMIWRCKQCTECVLCSACYNDDKHDMRHQFLRIDAYNSTGVEVRKRKISVRMRALGLFPGAKVARGRDWAWADQDGGLGSEGELITFENVAPASSRNLVKVRWPHGRCNSYRLGFQGYVDLQCVEEEAGGFYYRDHLPALDAGDLPYPLAPPEAFAASTHTSPSTSADTGISASSPSTSTASSDNTNTTGSSGHCSSASAKSSGACAAEVATDGSHEAQAVGGVVSAGKELSVAAGDRVAIVVDENSLRDLQENFGGCTDYMIKFVGHEGDVMEVKEDGKVMVRLKTKIYGFNPAALVKVTSFSAGDVVRIRGDVNQVKVLMRTVGRQTDALATCGRVGKVTAVGDTGELTVSMGGGEQYLLPPACCLLARHSGPGVAVTQDKVKDEKQAKDADAGKVKDTDAGKVKDTDTGKPKVTDKDDPAAYWNKQYNNNQTEAEAKSDSDSDSGPDVTKALMRLLGGKLGKDSSSDESKDPQVRTLFKAIDSDDMDTVRTIVTSDKGKLKSLHHSMTPLMFASYKGRPKIVRSLLDIGADINGRGGKGRTPLLVAIQGNEEDIALLLLDRGADPTIKNEHQRTPLHAAAMENMAQVAQNLIFMDVDVNAKDVVQDTPLFDAINKGNEAVAQVLLNAPLLNRFELNRNGFNMLQLASLRGNQRIVEMILTCEEGYPDVDDLLLGEWSALHIAANNDHVESVGYLVLLGGATVNMPDGRRHLTPLHLACKRRHIKSAEALIGLGASVNAHDIDGHTPLHLAMGKRLEDDDDDKGVPQSIVVEQRVNIARLLIVNGADVYEHDVTGRTALEYGLQDVKDQVLQFLTHSVDSVKSSQGATAPELTELGAATPDPVFQPYEAEQQPALDILNLSDAADEIPETDDKDIVHDTKVLHSFNVPCMTEAALNTYEVPVTSEKSVDAFKDSDTTEKTFDASEGSDTADETFDTYEDPDTTEKTLHTLDIPGLADEPLTTFSGLDIADDLQKLLGTAVDDMSTDFFQAFSRPGVAVKPVDRLVPPGTVTDPPDSTLSPDTADQPLSAGAHSDPLVPPDIVTDPPDSTLSPDTADQPLNAVTNSDPMVFPGTVTDSSDCTLSLDTADQPLSAGTHSDPLVPPDTDTNPLEITLSPDTADQPLSAGTHSDPLVRPGTVAVSPDSNLSPDTSDQPLSAGINFDPLVSPGTVTDPPDCAFSPDTADQPLSAGINSDTATIAMADENADQSAADSEADVDDPSSPDDAVVVKIVPESAGTQCARCDAASDVMLLPCRHKSVCRQCCDSIDQCPLCHLEVEERVPDNTDDQEDSSEEMNQFD